MIRISNGGVLFSDSNVLRFVRTDNYGSTKPTIFNRLTVDYDYKNVDDNWSFWQKFDIGDTILTQIGTIYTIDSFKVYDFTDDSLVDTIAVPTPVFTFADATYGTINYYDFEIDTTLLGGYYYVVATINTTQTYKCEPFLVETYNNANGIEIKWYNTINSSWDDWIYYNGSQEFLMKLDCRLFDPDPGTNKTVFENWNGNEKTLTGEPTLTLNLELGEIPLWLMEKMNLILQHDKLFVNDLEITNKDGIEKEWIKQGGKGTYIYTGRIKLTVNDYQLNDTFVAEAADTTPTLRAKGGQIIRAKGGQRITKKT